MTTCLRTTPERNSKICPYIGPESFDIEPILVLLLLLVDRAVGRSANIDGYITQIFFVGHVCGGVMAGPLRRNPISQGSLPPGFLWSRIVVWLYALTD